MFCCSLLVARRSRKRVTEKNCPEIAFGKGSAGVEKGILYPVGTPIGNLKDVSLRAPIAPNQAPREKEKIRAKIITKRANPNHNFLLPSV